MDSCSVINPQLFLSGKVPVILGSRGGTVVKALASHQCGPGLLPGPGIIIMWVEFVVGSLLAPRGVSPSTEKPTLPNSSSSQKAQTHVEQAPERP